MELYDLSILKIDINQTDVNIPTGLYDLLEPTFTLKDISRSKITVTKEQEMRIDIISNDIYQSVNYADLLLDINGIDNPLNIKAGDIIEYIPLDQLTNYRVSPNTTAENRRTLLSPNKSSAKDTTRQQYVEDNYQLPPTFLENTGSPVSTSGTKVIISPIK